MAYIYPYNPYLINSYILLNSSNMESFVKGLGALVLIPLVLIYAAFAQGFVLYKAWIWFSPIIGVHYTITFHAAIAIMLVAGLFDNHTSKSKDIDEDKWVTFGTQFIIPWFVLFIFWGFTFIL